MRLLRWLLVLTAGFSTFLMPSAALAASGIVEQGAPDVAWRCSIDKKAYRIRLSGEYLDIQPLRSGLINANLQVKTNKKGRQQIHGEWQSGMTGGFILVNSASAERISGYLLVPAPGIAADACATRTSAVLANLASANQQRTSCQVVNVAWNREDTVTLAQAAEDEARQEIFTTNLTASAQEQGASSPATTDSGLAGTWVFEDAGSQHYTHIEITLRSDGTYTKTLAARTPGWGGGGRVGAPSLGGTHSGRWTANGTLVHLGGNGNWPPSDHDLARFSKVQ